MGRWRERREYCSHLSNVQSIKMKCVYNYCVERCDIYAPIPSACRFWNVTKSATNRYQSISINLSIVIENRYQSITTRIFAIDWSSIININRLIDIDWYWLISIVVDYRFHRLDAPGYIVRQSLVSQPVIHSDSNKSIGYCNWKRRSFSDTSKQVEFVWAM